MKKQLVIAAIAALVASNAMAILPTASWRTPVVNESSKDVWMAWGGVQLKTKTEFIHLKPSTAKFTDKFTTHHITSDTLYLRYYVCESGNPVQKEIKYPLEGRKVIVRLQDDGKDIKVTETKEK